MSDDSERANITPYVRKASSATLAAVRAVNEAHGYVDDTPVDPIAPAAPAPAIPPRGPYRTGRTAQLNLKASPDTVRRFSEICRQYKWPSGLTMEHAVTALEEKIAARALAAVKGRDAEL